MKDMLNCKDVTKIIASSERSHWRRRLEIRMHLLMCKHCRKFSLQLDAIKTGVRKLFEPNQADAYQDSQIKDLEDRILRKLKRQ